MTRTLVNALSLSALTLVVASLGACDNQGKSTPPESAETAAPGGKTPSQPPADPGKLKTIMADLGRDMAELQTGIWNENFELIAEKAMKIADHPKVDDTEKQRVLKTMGSDFGAFVAMDKAVHNGAVSLSKAAASKDMTATLEQLASLQNGCVSCHSAFRVRLTQ